MQRYELIENNQEVMGARLEEDINSILHVMPYADVIVLLRKLAHNNYKIDLDIPLSLFSNHKLTVLESIVKYLRENHKLRYTKIALLLNRNEIAIRRCYLSAKSKFAGRFKIKPSPEKIPISIFRNRKLSAFENLVYYLKEKEFAFEDISELLKRNYKTIWTVYNRAIKKKHSAQTKQNEV